MNNLDDRFEIKKFLLKHKKEFQEYLNNKRSTGCFRCVIHKSGLDKNSCARIYKYIATSLGKEPIKYELLTCECLYSEMVRLASNSIIIKNE